MSVFYGRWSRDIYRLEARVSMVTPILVPSSRPWPLASPEWPPSSWSWPWQSIASVFLVLRNRLLKNVFLVLTCFAADRCCHHGDPRSCWRSSPPTVPSLTLRWINRKWLFCLTWYWSFSSSRSSFITSSSALSFSTRACSSAYCTLFNFSCKTALKVHPWQEF